MTLKIDWATYESAKYACENWHYSKSVPVSPIVKIGVWEENKFIGVILFSRGANKDLLTPYGLSQIEGCELTRVALTKHITPVSKIIKISILFLRKTNPKLKLIVSFADASKGHHGGIYQAGNWIYTGKTSPSIEYWKDNKKWHTRQISVSGYATQFGEKIKLIKQSECKKIKIPGKHRYLMPLDDVIKNNILKLSKPYPKRVSSIYSDAVAIQAIESGASPTDTLHYFSENKEND